MLGALRDGALAVADRTLSPAALRRLSARGDGVIVLYHRVSGEPDPAYPPLDPGDFAAHLQLLVEAFTIVPLDELVARRDAGRSLSGCCAITFDDGYADFRDVAYPVLVSRGLPATHFLVAECLLTGRPTWNLRLRRIQYTRGQRGQHIEPELSKAELARLLPAARDEILDAAERATPGLPTPPRMLRCDDLGAFDPDLVTWGGHTRTHTSLAGMPDVVLVDELAHARTLLQDAAGVDTTWVSYPNNSYDDAAVRAARTAGYDVGFRVGQRPVSAESDGMALPRFDVGAVVPRRLRAELGGVTPALRRVRARARAWRPGAA